MIENLRRGVAAYQQQYRILIGALSSEQERAEEEERDEQIPESMTGTAEKEGHEGTEEATTNHLMAPARMDRIRLGPYMLDFVVL